MQSLAPLRMAEPLGGVARRRNSSGGVGAQKALLSTTFSPPATTIAPGPRNATRVRARHSHESPCCGDDAAHAPRRLDGNFAVVGPARALKLADGSLLVTPSSSPGGGGNGGGDGSGGNGSGIATSGRCVLHGELMQLSGQYLVVEPPPAGGEAAALPSWPQPGAAERAVHRRCGGARGGTRPLDVLAVAALPVGASLVLRAGARLSHPLNTTPDDDEDDDDEGGGGQAAALRGRRRVPAGVSAALSSSSR